MYFAFYFLFLSFSKVLERVTMKQGENIRVRKSETRLVYSLHI